MTHPRSYSKYMAEPKVQARFAQLYNLCSWKIFSGKLEKSESNWAKQKREFLDLITEKSRGVTSFRCDWIQGLT